MYICDGYVGRQVSMAYVTKRKIALPEAKRDPEMGQLNSPWPTYGGSANYTIGLSGTVWPLYMGALSMPANGCSFRENFFLSRDQTDGVGT